MNYCDTYQTIQQLLYNGKADCIMLMQCSKSNVSFLSSSQGEGVRTPCTLPLDLFLLGVALSYLSQFPLVI